jgi:hypothetical protein
MHINSIDFQNVRGDYGWGKACIKSANINIVLHSSHESLRSYTWADHKTAMQDEKLSLAGKLGWNTCMTSMNVNHAHNCLDV